MREYNTFPDVVSGYALEEDRGWFSVILPEYGENLIINPSFEESTSGFDQVGAGTFEISATQQRRGVRSAKVAIQNNGEGIYYTISLASDTVFTFSADLYGHPGARYVIQAEAVIGGAIAGHRYYAGKGYWERIELTFTAPATGEYEIGLFAASMLTAHDLYTDGWQLEAKAYATTYIDGDQAGYLPYQAAYRWKGLPHYSVSVRSADTGTGGREVKLLDLGFTLLAVLGLGMAPLASVATPISTGGAYYQRSTYQTRQFTLVGAVTGGSLAELDRQRAALLGAIQPHRIASEQPLTLRYHRVGDAGDQSEVIDIAAVYEGGMEGVIDNFNQQRIGLTFRQYLPYLVSEGEVGVELDFADTLGESYSIFMRDQDGTWKTMDVGIDDGAGIIYAIARAPDGKIYAGGNFTEIGGVAAENLAYWDPDELAWHDIDFASDSSVQALAFDNLGQIYAGGSFGVKKYDGATWSDLGVFDDGAVSALLYTPDGTLYAGGSFTESDGDPLLRVAYWTGSAWAQVGTGFTSTVFSLLYDDGRVYAGISGLPGVYYWNSTAWISIGTGYNISSVRDLKIGPDGRLYAASGGQVIAWNGAGWSNVGERLLDGVSFGAVMDIAFMSDGTLYACGVFTQSDSGTVLLNLARYTGADWVPAEFEWPDNLINNNLEVNALLATPGGELYVGGIFDLTGGVVSGQTVIDNEQALVWPVIEFVGPGTLVGISNASSGASIYFNNLTLMAGERAVLTTDPLNFSFVSNMRGNLAGKIFTNSALQFGLLPGQNKINLLMTGTDSGSRADLRYKPVYLSLDGATR